MINKKFDINKYRESDKKLKSKNEEMTKIDKKYSDDKYNIDRKRNEEIRNIESKRYEELNKLKVTYEKTEQEHVKSIEQYQKDRQQCKRIINFRILLSKNNDFVADNYTTYKYDYVDDDYNKGKQKIYYNQIAILEKNKYLQMGIFITENRKPTNKYSLVVVGNTFFSDEYGDSKLLNFRPYSYGIDAHTEHANIRVCIKDFPTQKEAETYFNRNSKRILKDFREEHNKIIEEYELVIANTDTKEWKIEVLEHEKYYFKHNYSNGKEEPRYKEIIKEIEDLKK